MNNLIFGATGLIGHHLVREFPSNQNMITITRKPLLNDHQLYQNMISPLDEKSLLELKIPSNIENLFCCLGTTIKTAGSEQNFYQVDHDLVLNIAKLANQLKVKKLVIVSALGADTKSSVFYNRTKGEMERDVIAASLDVGQVIFLRPSLLLGDRSVLNQPVRLAEKLAIKLAPYYSPLLIGGLKKFAPVNSECVAKKMISVVFNEYTPSRFRIIENSDIILTRSLR